MQSAERENFQRRAGRSALLGAASAPLAHVLNNILNILSLRIDSVLAEPGLSEQTEEDLAACKRSLQRQAQLLESVARLASYVISGPGLGPADAREALREAAAFGDALYQRKFRCELRIADDFAVDVPPEELALLFSGLFLLAAERNPERRPLLAEASGAGARAEVALRVEEATPAFGERAELLLGLVSDSADACGGLLEAAAETSGQVWMRVSFPGAGG